MKRTVIIALLIIILTGTAYGYDFGLTVDASPAMLFNSGQTEVDWSGLSYTIKSAGWANGKINKALSYEFQGSYTFKDSRAFLLELDQLKLQGKYSLDDGGLGNLSFKAGRFSFSDFSTKVFSHTGDGIFIDWALPAVSFSMFTAYTGLIQGPAATIIMSHSDLSAQAVDPVPVWGPFASPRLVEGLRITFPALFAGQTLILSGLFQQDLHTDAQIVSGGNRLNTYYAGAGLMGPIPILPSFFYSAYGFWNGGSYGDNQILAYIAGGGLNYLIPAFLSSRVSVEGHYSSGDADYSGFYEGNTSGFSTMYTPVTPIAAGVIFTAQQSNLFYFSALYSMKPVKSTMIMLKGTTFFRSTAGPVSTGNTSADSTGLYLGTEANLNVMMRLLSDLGMSAGGNVFFPSSVMLDQSIQFKVTASVSLSL